jgi:hypothetical protein
MRKPSALLFSMAALMMGSCGGGDEGSGRTGRMEIRLVDAPADEVKEIVVTITKVTAHGPGTGWLTLAEETHTVDLLKLQHGAFQTLGVKELPAARLTQFRLYVKESGPNYVTTPDGKQHPLKVPSGPQSGIKWRGGFDWPACANGNVTFDFDGKKSIHVHPRGGGAGDEWILRPVIRVKSVEYDTSGCPETSAPVPQNQSPPPPAAPSAPPTSGEPSPPPPAPPPPATCANVTCADGQACINGACVTLIE